MKKFLIILSVLILTFVFCIPAFASNYTSYDGNSNNLSSTYVDYLKNALSDIDPDEDYILFRDSRYSYILAVSDNFTYVNNTLSGKAEILRLYVTDDYNYDNRYHVQLINDPNFKYTYDGYMIYSNCIDNIPSLTNASNGNSNLPYILIGVGVITMFFIGFMALNRAKGGMRA